MNAIPLSLASHVPGPGRIGRVPVPGPTRRLGRRSLSRPAVVLAALAAAAFAACTSAAGASAPVTISTRTIPGLGPVLVNRGGLTLYMFVPDKDKKVTCVSDCAEYWPPVFLPAGSKAVAKGKVQAKLLSSDSDPAGGRVVTYHGWPLYTYIGDTSPGVATGQALNLNGGLWYVLSPAGKVIHKKPS